MWRHVYLVGTNVLEEPPSFLPSFFKIIVVIIIIIIVTCSRKPEYLNQSDRPLLDNGYDKTKYATLSRWQL
jgi:hypothetical protein